MGGEAGRRESRPDGAEKAVDAMRARALEMWGRERTEAIEPALRRAALAVWRLSSLEFEFSEPPAFFFGEFDDVAPDGRLSANDDDE